MAKFNLDKNNFLTPYEVIKCTEIEFQNFFIDHLLSLDNQRELRWNEYCNFISFIKKHRIKNGFRIWIYGSLVGNYKIPNDVDVVLFLNQQDYVEMERIGFNKYIQTFAKTIFNIHCDHVFPIPIDEESELQLKDNFSSKQILVREGKPKGAIEIDY